MFNICIVDDNRTHINKTKEIVNQVMKEQRIAYHIDIFYTLEEIERLIHSQEFHYHCILLDIQFKTKTSFPLVNIINHICPNCHIIYITGYLEYSRQISHTNYSYFIYKKDIQNELPLAIKKIINDSHSHLIPLLVRGKKVLINPNEIMYIESHLHKVKVICINEIKEFYMKLDDISNILKPYSHFIRCHNSYIVNTHFIKEFNTTNITMKDNTNITISRKYKSEVKEYLNQYFNPFFKI